MKFALDAASGVNLIRGYAPGEVRVGERVVNTNCIVTADALIEDWTGDLEAVFALEPQVLLWGTGTRLEWPPAEVRAACAARGIGLEAMDLGAACRTFNVLVQEGRRVAAGLFLA